MTTTTPGEAHYPQLDEAEVAEFLRGDPDFLARHPDVLAALEIRHDSGQGTVSLVERQVRLLREQNERLERRLQDLLRTARANERVGGRLLGLGRGLLEADSLDAVLSLVRDMLLSEFSADVVAIRLIDDGQARQAARDPQRFLTPGAPALTHFADCLADGAPVCGTLGQDQIEALFGAEDPPVSAAVVPLVAGRPLGLIGLGSRATGHFRAEMGTLFLAQLGELVTTGVARHLEQR